MGGYAISNILRTLHTGCVTKLGKCEYFVSKLFTLVAEKRCCDTFSIKLQIHLRQAHSWSGHSQSLSPPSSSWHTCPSDLSAISEGLYTPDYQDQSPTWVRFSRPAPALHLRHAIPNPAPHGHPTPRTRYKPHFFFFLVSMLSIHNPIFTINNYNYYYTLLYIINNYIITINNCILTDQGLIMISHVFGSKCVGWNHFKLLFNNSVRLNQVAAVDTFGPFYALKLR